MSIFPSSRYSPAVDLSNGTRRFGFVKFRMGHSRRGTVFLVEHLFLPGARSWSFFQPSFFGPPQLAFMPRGRHRSSFSVDVVSPRRSDAVRLIVDIEPKGRRKTYPDGAQLYWCSARGPADLDRHAAGVAHRLPDGDFALRLQHHTDDRGFEGITNSGYFRASPWNLQGARKLTNIAHVYFTSLPTIEDDNDLARIAMSRAGQLHFQTTAEQEVNEILGMTVYRADTTGRTRTIVVDVPAATISPPQLYYHPLANGQHAYYEVIGPEILRVAVKPGAEVRIRDGMASAAPEDMKAFNYVVMGHAGTREGLIAPYDEESTEEVMFLEDLTTEDVFEFWQRNANSDLVTGRHREVREVERM
jgi:hypothetical protein